MAAFSYWNRGTSVYSATADLYRATFDELLISLWRRYWYRSNGSCAHVYRHLCRRKRRLRDGTQFRFFAVSIYSCRPRSMAAARNRRHRSSVNF